MTESEQIAATFSSLPQEHWRNTWREVAGELASCMPGTNAEQIALAFVNILDAYARLLNMVPEKVVYLPHGIVSDIPLCRASASAGFHEAHTNQHGAVSVIDSHGTLIGVKPDEFTWVRGKPEVAT